MQLSSWHFLVFYINFCLLSSLNELQSCNSQVNTVILRYHKPGYPYLINEMSHNLKEIETLLSDEINGLGDLAGSLGGAQKHTWRWNLKIFFHGINFYYKRGYFCEKRGYKSSKTKKFFFLHKYRMPLFSAMVLCCFFLVWLRPRIKSCTTRIM